MNERVRATWALPGLLPERIRRALREMWATRTDGSPELRVLHELTAQAVHEPALRALLIVGPGCTAALAASLLFLVIGVVVLGDLASPRSVLTALVHRLVSRRFSWAALHPSMSSGEPRHGKRPGRLEI